MSQPLGIVPLPYIYNDGGRSTAGYRPSGDCVIRAAAIASQTPYEDVRELALSLASKERVSHRRGVQSKGRSLTRGKGVYKATTRKLLEKLGGQWVSCMSIGSGCKVHLRLGEIPHTGRLAVQVSKHLTAVIDGWIHDTFDPSRGGTRCVYGYWVFPERTDR